MINRYRPAESEPLTAVPPPSPSKRHATNPAEGGTPTKRRRKQHGCAACGSPRIIVPVDGLPLSPCAHDLCSDCITTTARLAAMQETPPTLSCPSCACIIDAELVAAALDVTSADTILRAARPTRTDRVCADPACGAPLADGRSERPDPARAECSRCGLAACLPCGAKWHALTDCVTVKRFAKQCPACATPAQGSPWGSRYMRCPCGVKYCRSCGHAFRFCAPNALACACSPTRRSSNASSVAGPFGNAMKRARRVSAPYRAIARVNNRTRAARARVAAAVAAQGAQTPM